MEREYTVGALLVLVTIFVIALIVYFTVPEFSQSVKSIADDVFGTLPKARQLEEEKYQLEEAKSMFESVKKCIEQIKEKKEGGCTCYLELADKELPESYYIRKLGNDLRLEQGNAKVPETEPFDVEGLNFCVLGEKVGGKFEYSEIPEKTEIYINSKGGKLKLNELEFIKDTPEFYSLKEGDKSYICFVTEKSEKNAVDLRKLIDCKSSDVVLLERAKKAFQDFIQLYRKCKEYKKTGMIDKCKCGSINFGEIVEPYAVQVLQESSGTDFFLKNTNIKETVFYNHVAKLFRSGWYDIFSGKYKAKEFEKNEEIERKIKEIVYYGGNRDIYLADPEDVTELPLCGGDINIYLGFDNRIKEEEYKQKLIEFSKEVKDASGAEDYFKPLYTAAKTHNVDFFMAVAMITQESTWNPKTISSSGAAGLMQLMPLTAEEVGLNTEGPHYNCKKVKGYTVCDCNSNDMKPCDFKNDERFDPGKNINAGIKYIKKKINELDKDKKLDPSFENILAAYNAGFGTVQDYGGYKGFPPSSETAKYVKVICGYYEKLNVKVCYA